MGDPAAPAPRPAESDASASGRGVLQHLYAASRLGALWGFESKLAEQALTNLQASLRAASGAQGELRLRFENDLAYLNEHRVRVDFSGYTAYRHAHDRCARHGIGEIVISAAAARRDLVALLTLLESRRERADGSPGGSLDDAFDAAREELRRAGVAAIAVGPLPAQDARRAKLGPTDVRQAAIQSYFRLLFVAKQSQVQAREGKRLTPRKCRRALQDVIDVLERGEHLILAMAQVRNYHGFGPTHAANAAVLACALGLRFGLHKLHVADLGLAALLHEVVQHDPSRTSEAALRERDARAARAVLPHLGFADGALRAVLAIRDLHAPARTGAGPGGDAPLFQRIVRAVCFLDTVTTPAGPDVPPHSFRDALAAMARDDGTRFDPTVVRGLRGLLGIHPFGTVVRLDSGERAIVHGRNPHFDQPARPVVRVFADAEGRRVEDGEVLDLSRWDRSAERFARSIVEVSPPAIAFPKPADYVRVL